MVAFSKDIDISHGLKILTTLSCGFFSGGCAAIGFCTQPALLDLDEKHCLAATKSFLKRARPMPISLLIATVSGLGAYMLSARTSKDSAWLAAVLAFGTIIPYTVIFIGPINARVLKDQVDDENDVKPLITKWINHHRIRTVVALGIFGYLTYTLSTGK